jgi:hypothetical protein
MSNYTKGTDFRSKDFLPSGDPDKVVSGSEIDTEFNNIATAIATKADAPVGGGTTIVSNPTTSQALTKGWGQAVIALTDGATVTIDATGGNIFTWTIAGNRTLAFPTGLKSGQEVIIVLTTSGTSRTITYAAGWFKPSTLTVQPNAATAKVAVLRARANGDGTKLFVTHFYNDYVAA